MDHYEMELRTLEERPTAVVLATLPVTEIGRFLGSAYATVAAALAGQGFDPAGMPFARYRRVDDGRFAVEAGFAAPAPVAPEGDVRPSTLPAGAAVATWHVGPYDALEAAYGAIAAWLAEHGAVADGDPWEVYYSDPVAEPDPERWRTEVVQPYRAG